MKRLTATLLAAAMCMGTFAGCGSNTEETTDNSNAGAAAGETAAATTESQTASAENVHLDALNVYFVPSRDPEEIVTATEPLSDLLKNELAGLGYDVDSVNISVGTTYEAVGEALSAGTADVGFIPGGTYVLYDDGCDVILTATRDGLNKDSDNPADWNDGQPTEASDKQAVSYRALFIAGPSEKGQELADKVNSGEELTWDDLDSANWSVMSSSSPAGYIYPALWMQDRYGKGITDLSNAVQSDSYASAFARLASGQVDVLVTYADARRDYPGLYELPNIQGHLKSEDALLYVKELGLDPLYIEELPPAKHIFSHIEWRMQAYRIKVSSLKTTQDKELIFVSKEQSGKQYAIPSAFGAYAKYIKEETIR